MRSLLSLLTVALGYDTEYININDDTLPTCQIKVQFVVLADVSYSMSAHAKEIANVVEDLMNEFRIVYDSLEFGVATFSDKPLPGIAYGNGLGIQGDYDHCYNVVNPLDRYNDSGAIIRVYHHNTKDGGDSLEANLDAFYNLYHDKGIGLTRVEKQGPVTKVLQIALVVGDSPFHVDAQARIAVSKWNDAFDSSPPGVLTQWVSKRTQGFGSPSLFKITPFADDMTGSAELLYYAYLHEVDNFIKNGNYDSNLVQHAEKVLGPKTFPVPKIRTVGTLTNTPELCRTYEYVDAETISEDTLNGMIIPLVLNFMPVTVDSDMQSVCGSIGHAVPTGLPGLYDGIEECMNSQWSRALSIMIDPALYSDDQVMVYKNLTSTVAQMKTAVRSSIVKYLTKMNTCHYQLRVPDPASTTPGPPSTEEPSESGGKTPLVVGVLLACVGGVALVAAIGSITVMKLSTHHGERTDALDADSDVEETVEAREDRGEVQMEMFY